MLYLKRKALNVFYDVIFKICDQFRCDLIPHMYIIESILFWGSRWSVLVWQNFQKTHMCGAGVCGVKSYCAQSVRVCQNWLHTNTLLTSMLDCFHMPPCPYWPSYVHKLSNFKFLISFILNAVLDSWYHELQVFHLKQ